MRNRRPVLRKTSFVATALLLVLSACSGDDESNEISNITSSTAAATTVSSATSPLVPSTTTTTTTTNAPALAFAGIGDTVLVTAEDGVYQISPEGNVALLVAGRVANAVDDTQGGLLFQVGRGRSWDDSDQWPTVVWWIPRGASRPQELLVPTPGTDHSLSLHDAYATDDGFAVLYTRHEGVVADQITDRLRRLDVPTREVTELYSQGAFEQGYGDVSTNGELIAGVSYGQVGSGCFIYDLDGQPTDLVPSVRSDLDLTSDDYVGGCRLSPDGHRLVFETEQYEENTLASTTLHVWDLVAGTEASRFAIPGRAGVADVSVTRLMATVADDVGLQAHVLDISDPEADPIPLPIAGMARFVYTPIDIAAPVHVGAGPSYYRYGDDGLYRVAHGIETSLVAAPVTWAVDDLMGGAIYRLHWQLDAETTYWLRADGSTDTLAHDPRFVAAFEGEPTAVMIVSDEWDADMFDEDVDLLLVGLRSDSERRMPNIGFSGDGWSFPRSYGDGLFVGVDGAAAGCGYSDTVISFWDGDGNRIDHPHNPVAEPCGPCELSAAISPDGRLLAYSHRADSPSDYQGRMCDGGRDDWWNETQEILAEVVVLDLGTGDELYRVTAPARASVVDFDGRFVVVDQGDWVESKTVSVIYDTWGVREPLEVESGVALTRRSTTPATSELVLRQDGLEAVSFGDPVDDVMAVLAEHFGAPNHDELHESPFALPPGWHGADRGPDACHVATHGNICFDYLRFAWWENQRFWVLFSDIEANPEAAPDDDGYWVQVPPSFQGYGYGGNESAPLYTAHGITVGSTAEDLLSLGPIVSFNWTPCGGQVEFTISDPGQAVEGSIRGLLDDQDFETFEETGFPNERARILTLDAGQSSSC